MTRAELRRHFAAHGGIGALAGFALWAVLNIGDYRARPVFCIGIGLALGLALALVRVVSHAQIEPAPPPTGAVDEEAPAPYADLYFIEYRLSWGSVERDRYERRVRPLLVRLATERLLQRHGIDPDREPNRARQIVGEQLWMLMTGPAAPEGSRPPRPREVDELVQAIEQI